MAIAFRSENYSVNSGTCNKPAGATTNDILIAAVRVDSARPDSVPSGWSEVGHYDYGLGTSYFYVYKKTGTGSEPASYTWGATGGTFVRIEIVCYSGVDTTTPVDVYSLGAASGTSPVAASVTATVKGMLICFIGGQTVDGSATSTPPTGMTERADNSQSIFYYDLQTVAELQLSATGATGSKTFTTTQSVSGIYYSIVLKPIAVPVTVSPSTLSLTTSRLSPTIRLGQRPSPSSLATSLTGYAPTIRLAKKAIPSTLATSLTQQTPTVRVGRTVLPSTLATALASFAPTIIAHQLAIPSTLATVLTQQTPAVSVGTRYLPASLGLALSPFAPTVLTPRVAIPDPGALVTAGFAPTILTPRTVRPGVASLVLTTYAPSILIPARFFGPSSTAALLRWDGDPVALERFESSSRLLRYDN